MATNWDNGAGFFNSPQDFLFKGNDNTWYGQGPAGQDEAGRTPTASDYYFGQQAPQPSFLPPQVYGGPTRPEGWNPGPSVRGGYTTISQTGNFTPPVPEGALWQRYQALMANPTMATADPAYQFMFNQGQEAMNRTAAAKRMRFAGKTMLDAQNFGQGLAAQNLRTLLPELRAGAQDEYGRMAQEAQARHQYALGEATNTDPYGHARRVASYKTLGDYLAANPNADYYKSAMLYNQGKELLKKLGAG